MYLFNYLVIMLYGIKNYSVVWVMEMFLFPKVYPILLSCFQTSVNIINITNIPKKNEVYIFLNVI
jgi:hypothetical protein